jgi:hypothetical protein
MSPSSLNFQDAEDTFLRDVGVGFYIQHYALLQRRGTIHIFTVVKTSNLQRPILSFSLPVVLATQDSGRWRPVVNAVMNLQVLAPRSWLSWSTWSFTVNLAHSFFRSRSRSTRTPCFKQPTQGRVWIPTVYRFWLGTAISLQAVGQDSLQMTQLWRYIQVARKTFEQWLIIVTSLSSNNTVNHLLLNVVRYGT